MLEIRKMNWKKEKWEEYKEENNIWSLMHNPELNQKSYKRQDNLRKQ